MSSDEKSSNKKRTHSASSEEDEPTTKRKVESPSTITEWDVEECRGDHESEEHWELRKQFLLQNMGRFPKSRLICLSQVFANHEFLGCKYPEETMELVHELSMGIVEEYREKQKNRLQRTFVKASDAAERKSKGTNRNSNKFSNNTDERRPIQFVPSASSKSSSCSNQHASNFSTGHPYPDLRNMILLVYAYNVGENAICIVHRSCSAVNVPVAVDYTGTLGSYKCTYKIGKHLVIHSDEGHHSKDSAKSQAAKLVLRELQKHCYTFVTKVKIMPESDGKEIAKQDIDNKHEPDINQIQTVPEDNIGNKLLKMMGWTGGGLGKNEQGIHEAISVDGVVGRSRLGLGNAAGVSFNKKIQELLDEHKRIGFPYDLKFSSEFSKDERKEIHAISQRLGLKSKSFGKDEDRYIVVSEKVSRKNLLENTIAEGGETEKYCVIPPGGRVNKMEQYLSS